MPTAPAAHLIVSQPFAGITVAQYKIEPNSALTIQQTVAMSIGYNMLSPNVAITSVVTDPSSPTGIVVRYSVTGPAAQFASTSAAYVAYSNALKASIATGAFSGYLVAQANTNGAIYLAGSNVAPQQATIAYSATSPPTGVPTAAPTFLPGDSTFTPTLTPSVSPSLRPTSSPTYSAAKPTPEPTMAPTLFGTLYATQTFTGLTLAQYNSEPNSDLTIQQTVAASIGNNVAASNVIVISAVSSPDTVLAVTVGYVVTGGATQFIDSAAAYTAYTNALTTSIASGAFAATLKAKAAANAATYLADSSVAPQQVVTRNVFSLAVTKAPTTAPSYLPGNPSPNPTVEPTTTPTASPTASPTYTEGAPTPIPSLAPTIAPAYLYATQTFTSITVAQYNSEPNSDLTIQQTVAISIGYDVVPASVSIASVAPSPNSPTAITVSYVVAASSAQFPSTAAAYAAYSTALSASIASGSC